MEPIAVTSQKHDPAWKHCQMFKNGEKVQLKCVYCGKIFKGGGIHRIKEHLAGQKGNASSCLRVEPDIRLLMQESLKGAVMKKRKKQKVVEEISDYNVGGISDIDALADNNFSLNPEVGLIPVPNTFDQNVYVDTEEEVGNKVVTTRKKKQRTKKGSALFNPNAIVASPIASKKIDNHVDMAIGRFLFDVGVPLEAVNSVYFQPMVDAIASNGPGLTGPSYHDLRSWILKSVVQEVRNDVDQCSGSWGIRGCSILVNEWVSEKGKIFMKILVHCSEGAIFLKTIDITKQTNNTDSLYNILKDLVEEVGLSNVLQVITNGDDDRYIDAGQRLTDTYPSVFWAPCAATSVDLILQDIKHLDWVKQTLEQAKTVSRFIYNHNAVLNLMRRYTFGVDLIDPGTTCSATDFMTLKRMVSIRHNLQSMVSSDEWIDSMYSKKPEAYVVVDYVNSTSFWSACSLVSRLVDPLLGLMRLSCSDKRPAMGYVYAGLYRAKEIIKKELVHKKEYSVYWNIIDHRWKRLHRHPLHAAGFYLNPKFFYSTEGDVHLHIRSLVYDCIEKLVSDPVIQDKVVKEIGFYHNGDGDFGRKMAVRARDTLSPAEWWSTYGGRCPNLGRLAIRILSQTCGLISCKRNQFSSEQMHETLNCIEHGRLNDLAFVQNNMWLKQRNRGQEFVDPISSKNLDVVEEWVKPLCSEDTERFDWMTVDPPLGNTMLLGEPIDDIEALGEGFDDYEIFDGMKDIEE